MTAPIQRWTAGLLGPAVEDSLRRLASAGDVAHIAVMPDAHLAHDVCVGTVLATRNRIYPAAVGGDIGCGMAAVGFDASAEMFDDERAAARVLSALYSSVPTLKHRRAQLLPAALADHPLSHAALDRRRGREGALQLGTLGRGNHFVELQRDDQGRLWLMVHSGSRSMGVAIRDHHSRNAAIDEATALPWIDAGSDAGERYLADHAWALAYARCNRERIVACVVDVMERSFGVRALGGSEIACHHNEVRREEHAGDALLVHRKGAVSAREGEPGIVPGSMGAASYHTSGRGCVQALRSSSHGAGRTMSRTDARRTISLGAFRRQMRGIWFDHRLERRLVDEAPAAYRDIGAVMRAQRELTRVVRRVTPVLSYKGT